MLPTGRSFHGGRVSASERSDYDDAASYAQPATPFWSRRYICLRAAWCSIVCVLRVWSDPDPSNGCMRVCVCVRERRLNAPLRYIWRNKLPPVGSDILYMGGTWVSSRVWIRIITQTYMCYCMRQHVCSIFCYGSFLIMFTPIDRIKDHCMCIQATWCPLVWRPQLTAGRKCSQSNHQIQIIIILRSGRQGERCGPQKTFAICLATDTAVRYDVD